MKCYYHPDKEAKAQCQSCGKYLCEKCIFFKEGETTLCSKCLAIKAADEVISGIDDRNQKRNEKKEEKDIKKRKIKKISRSIKYLLFFICLFIFILRAPFIFKSFNEAQPLRIGSNNTDAETDECIKILWDISKLIQQGKLPGSDFKCPKSGKPFEVIKTKSDIIVRSSAPELYGLKDIRVSKNKPVPELVK